jgi:hypothetical protein
MIEGRKQSILDLRSSILDRQGWRKNSHSAFQSE